ncbi:MAG: oxygenase MpaB family protein [Bacteroidia bacterium]
MKVLDDELNALRLVTDAPADAVVARLVAENGPEQARELFSVLINNIDVPVDQVPGYVMDYFREQGAVPDGIDMARVIRGQRVFVDFGPAMALMLYFKSLPTCYLNWKLCETLAITGRLDDTRTWPAVFSRRVGETTQFVLDVMTPGSLRADGNGIRTTLKVRLVHASIRHFVGRSPKFDEAAWQKPINQEDLAHTLLTFGLAMIQGSRQMGLKLSAQAAEDFYYAWRLVGHFLGIDPLLNPNTVAEAEALQQALLQRLSGSSEQGKSITRALLDFSKEVMLPTDLLDNSPEFLLRYYMGDAQALLLGVEAKKGCLAAMVPGAIARYFGWVEKLEDKGLGIEKLANKLGLAVVRGLMKRFQSVKGRSLYVPTEMAEEWGL